VPWDREQDERSIVPHTVEGAYELADAAASGDDPKLVDELGDVLFQVHFLALLLEERGAGGLAEVAENTIQKLIRRHPHVFRKAEQGGHHRSTPGREAEDVLRADDVLRNWDRIKRDQEARGRASRSPICPRTSLLLYARKVQRRATSAGFQEPTRRLGSRTPSFATLPRHGLATRCSHSSTSRAASESTRSWHCALPRTASVTSSKATGHTRLAPAQTTRAGVRAPRSGRGISIVPRPGVGIDLGGVVFVGLRRLLLALGRAGPLFGLGGLAACAGSLLVGRRLLFFRTQSVRVRLFAVLGRDLAPVIQPALTRPPQHRRDQSDHDYGGDHDQDNCEVLIFDSLR
jgi:NTP pyrophosphatase (non-canonical NTP hydrolase)